MLKKLGIVMGDGTKAGTAFEEMVPNFLTLPYDKPSDYVKDCWQRYEARATSNSNLNGKIFEYILATLCVREGLLPLYLSSKVAFVPNVEYDLMFYSAECGPICLSVKTSLRERYKQADLEAIALKYVHRKSLSYLVTLEKNEAQSVKQKIKTGDVIGLNDVIVATTGEFDELINNLKGYKLQLPPPIEIITSTQIITNEKLCALK